MKKAVDRYIEAKRAMTLCKQEHFRQLCSWCRKYNYCDVYHGNDSKILFFYT